MRLAALAALVTSGDAGRGSCARRRRRPEPASRSRAKEFWFALSRSKVTEGPAIVELVNFGEDPHDLRLRRIGGTRTYRTPLVQPGGYFDLELKLLPGRYKLWCSIANHEALGMKATLVVRKR